MNKELFGVFGDGSRFRRYRSPEEFDQVVEGESITVGVRDPALSVPNRTAVAADGAGTCVLWGEVYTPAGAGDDPARWFLERYAERGTDALDGLNGSFLAVVDRGGEAIVASDPIRSLECFYADLADGRVFGTDPAAVARTVPSPEIRPRAMLELLCLSVVTGDRTVLRQLHRLPFDGFVDRDGTGTLDRFVYEPRQFDYAGELAERLERAMRRRSSLPGRKGLMLSGGYDSRSVLVGIDDLDRAYTIGELDGDVVTAARRVADQYGTPHRALPIDERYLDLEPRTISYGQGIKESLHIHHAGYARDIDVDTVYHALHFDTFLRGHFLPKDGVEVMGYSVPRSRLDPDPDVLKTVCRRYEVVGESADILSNYDCLDEETCTEFVRSVVDDRLAALGHRCDSVYDAIELFGIENQPTTPFRTHLADTHLESFIVADVELLDWHLTTPPEHRNTRTFLEAMRRLDPQVFRHSPHNRPHESRTFNEVEWFLRRKLPFVDPFDLPWPDCGRLYERRDLDQRLFDDCPAVHNFPPRLKLRVNDVVNWLELAVDGAELSPDDVLCPPVEVGGEPVPDGAARLVRPRGE